MTVSGTAWRGQGPRQDETRRIATINGRTVTLDRPLRFDHRSPVTDAGAYVAHSTRTVAFSSASGKIAERGHVMFMHSDAVAVHGAAFVNLGRTDKTRFADTLGVKITNPGHTTPGRVPTRWAGTPCISTVPVSHQGIRRSASAATRSSTARAGVW